MREEKEQSTAVADPEVSTPVEETSAPVEETDSDAAIIAELDEQIRGYQQENEDADDSPLSTTDTVKEPEPEPEPETETTDATVPVDPQARAFLLGEGFTDGQIDAMNQSNLLPAVLETVGRAYSYAEKQNVPAADADLNAVADGLEFDWGEDAEDYEGSPVKANLEKFKEYATKQQQRIDQLESVLAVHAQERMREQGKREEAEIDAAFDSLPETIKAVTGKGPIAALKDDKVKQSRLEVAKEAYARRDYLMEHGMPVPSMDQLIKQAAWMLHAESVSTQSTTKNGHMEKLQLQQNRRRKLSDAPPENAPRTVEEELAEEMKAACAEKGIPYKAV